MKRFPILASLASALALVQCASEPAKPAAPLNPARDYQPASGEPSVDDVARFLAGRPVNSGEKLARIQQTSTDYHRHALDLDYLERKLSSRRRKLQMQYFQDTLRPLTGSPSTVLYPFGGPDILHATSMFPRASSYILVGLEPVGAVPGFEGDPQPLLDRIGRVMEGPLRHGYFVTEDMRQAPPAVPILLASLAITGARVDGVRSLDLAGRPAAEIRFRGENGGSKRVVYVRADLSNRGFDGSLAAALDQLGGDLAYFKAASYLLHDNAFSGVRQWVLDRRRPIIQDDSGIPYRYFGGDWSLTLLGRYERPIPLFVRWRQADLAAAYQSIGGSGPPVPFGSGYHIRDREANLQVAVPR